LLTVIAHSDGDPVVICYSYCKIPAIIYGFLWCIFLYDNAIWQHIACYHISLYWDRLKCLSVLGLLRRYCRQTRLPMQ